MNAPFIPPLNALLAFEATARHLSFTKAANELHLTQAAISHQIRSLEDRLGTALFVRAKGRISLTTPGSEYLEAVSGLLVELSTATDRVSQGATNTRSRSVACPRSRRNACCRCCLSSGRPFRNCGFSFHLLGLRCFPDQRL